MQGKRVMVMPGSGFSEPTDAVRRYDSIDLMRFAGAIIIVAAHSISLSDQLGGVEFEILQVIARIVVPFFFVASGFFFMTKMVSAPDVRTMVMKSLGRLLRLYVAWCAVYFVYDFWELLRGGGGVGVSALKYLRDFIFLGGHFHLWYIPALVLGLYLLYWGYRLSAIPVFLGIAMVLFFIGVGGDTYYGVVRQFPAVDQVYRLYFDLFKSTRNGMFFGFLYVMVGGIAALTPGTPDKRHLGRMAMFWFAVLHIEAYTLRHFGIQRDYNMYVSAVPFTMAFFGYLRRVPLQFDARFSRYLRVGSMGIYFIHGVFMIPIELAIIRMGLHVDTRLCFLVIVSASLAAVSVMMRWDHKLMKVLLS